MKYLKSFNEDKDTKSKIIDQINQTIDDVMIDLKDIGFDEVEIIHSDYDVFKRYDRENFKSSDIDIMGYISNGEFKFDKKENDNLDHDTIELFYNAMYHIQGLVGIDIHFLFVSFYGAEKLIIYTNI